MIQVNSAWPSVRAWVGAIRGSESWVGDRHITQGNFNVQSKFSNITESVYDPTCVRWCSVPLSEPSYDRGRLRCRWSRKSWKVRRATELTQTSAWTVHWHHTLTHHTYTTHIGAECRHYSTTLAIGPVEMLAMQGMGL